MTGGNFCTCTADSALSTRLQLGTVCGKPANAASCSPAAVSLPLAAEFMHKGVRNTPDNSQEFIDTGLIVVSPAFVHRGKRDIDRRVKVAVRDELLNPVSL